MKLLIASDIHGSSYYLEKLIENVNKLNPDKIVLLGDFLYHGARNDLPERYDTKKCFQLLNSLSDKIIAVQGNCDSEVDQMVLNFPITDVFSTLNTDGFTFYFSHGHKLGVLPTLKENDILCTGHTHVYLLEKNHINPGSISIPKQDDLEHTFIFYENKTFYLYNLDGILLKQMKL